jgi:hypothetical protein
MRVWGTLWQHMITAATDMRKHNQPLSRHGEASRLYTTSSTAGFM